MVGEEQQRADEPTIIRTCRIDTVAYVAADHRSETTLPFKRVLAVLAVNAPTDTNVLIPIRVATPNVLHIFALVAATGDEVANGTDLGNVEVVCVLPNE